MRKIVIAPVLAACLVGAAAVAESPDPVKVAGTTPFRLSLRTPVVQRSVGVLVPPMFQSLFVYSVRYLDFGIGNDGKVVLWGSGTPGKPGTASAVELSLRSPKSVNAFLTCDISGTGMINARLHPSGTSADSAPSRLVPVKNGRAKWLVVVGQSNGGNATLVTITDNQPVKIDPNVGWVFRGCSVQMDL